MQTGPPCSSNSLERNASQGALQRLWPQPPSLPGDHAQPSPAQSLRLTRSHREPDHACSISTAPALPRPAPGDCLGSIWPGPLLPTPDPWLSSTLLLPAPPPLCTEVQTPGCGVSEGRGNIPAIGQDLGLQCFAVGRAAVGDSRGHQRGAESSRFSFPGS